MNNTELSLEQLESCNGGLGFNPFVSTIVQAAHGYIFAKSIDQQTKDRPINTALDKARKAVPEPLSWYI